jgi:protein-L-isoaspartate(D-aspartate) O-methyltransferase
VTIPAARAALWASVGRWVENERVLAALTDTPRELYVPPDLQEHAFEDRALPIDAGQTISQPTIVAMTTDAALPQPDDVALDVGTGSGFQAAVLARLARRVYGIEVRRTLAAAARRNLARDPGVRDAVRLVVGDAHRGFPARLLFDVIVVAAAAPTLPPALVAQLAPGGRLVAPIGAPGAQELVLVTKGDDGILAERSITGCAFVPLVRR